MIPGLNTIGAKVAAGAALSALIALAVVGWLYKAEVASHAATKAELRAAEAEIELLNLDAGLKDAAATEREADNAALRNEERDLNDARNHQGDNADTRRIRRLCVVMRQQGRDTNGIPACAGLDGQAGT